jgi:putative peptidoglycan lipid II flippase
MFPFFSDVVARGEWGKLHRQLKKTLQVVVAFAAPLTAILIWQAPLIVALLFERGAFTAEHTHRVAEVLRFAALQIPFYVIGVMLSRIVVALQGSGFTLLLSWFSLMLNIGLNALLMRSMGVAGIALSTAFVYFVSATAMWIYVSKKIAQRREREEVPS